MEGEPVAVGWEVGRVCHHRLKYRNSHFRSLLVEIRIVEEEDLVGSQVVLEEVGSAVGSAVGSQVLLAAVGSAIGPGLVLKVPAEELGMQIQGTQSPGTLDRTQGGIPDAWVQNKEQSH